MIVVKVGGGEGVDLDAVCDDAAELVREGERVVLIHGGSHETNVLSEKLGHPPVFITSPSGHTSRRTDRRTLEIFEMAYCGKVNKGVVERLQKCGVNAVGLSGLDGRIWEGRRKEVIRSVEADGRVRIIRDDYTGVVDKVNVRLLMALLKDGYTPALTPPAVSVEGEAMNVDADRAAGATAVALGADALLLLSNVPGLFRSFPDESSLIGRVERGAIEEAAACAEGRMKKKVMGAADALEGGVGRVVLGDSRVENPIRAALEGRGTVFA
ncbi:MAG: [LysW]-aminoadipate kinase [Phycisphaeraceae bacterium]|nr:MAG: [LysW]-aminoadipate kinase [Phycisphaeraceae bacterium]